MALFSERNGFVKPREIFQIDSLDLRTKNRIWDWVVRNFINTINTRISFGITFVDAEKSFLLKHIYCDIYGNSADDLKAITLDSIHKYFKNLFYSSHFGSAFDLVELIVSSWKTILDTSYGTKYNLQIKTMNCILEEEKVGYRLINGLMTRIVEDAEINTIEESLKTEHKSVTDHIQSALHSFADRNNPDYRNAIQESFSAVEAWLKNECGNPKSEFRSALQTLKDKGKLDIHPALINAFKDFYAYMSDEKGLRHALLDQSTKFEFEETKCMIVFCCTMINYLEAKKK